VRYTTVWVKQNGQWKVVHLHYSMQHNRPVIWHNRVAGESTQISCDNLINL
jgi:hypothetical protein